jgi:hypothetical protein
MPNGKYPNTIVEQKPLGDQPGGFNFLLSKGASG